MTQQLTYTNELGRTFKAKQTGAQFFYWSPRANRWLPVAAAKVA